VIAAQTNTIQAGYIAESGATLLEFATPDETIAAVRNGEADAVFADKDFLVPIVEEDGELTFVGEDVPLGGGVGMGLRESDTELRRSSTRPSPR
jgi:polar amino acid transport system substrate-binding protein